VIRVLRAAEVSVDGVVTALARPHAATDPDTVARIKEFHAEDYALYAYARDVIYPRQVQRFGPGQINVSTRINLTRRVAQSYSAVVFACTHCCVMFPRNEANPNVCTGTMACARTPNLPLPVELMTT